MTGIKAEAWKKTWPDEVERSILRLESELDKNERPGWSINQFADLPTDDPNGHVLVALSYMSKLNLRMAIREFETVLETSPQFADGYWGIALSMYHLAVVDMLIRGRCKISRTELRFVKRRMSEHAYLRREVKILVNAALMFTSVGRGMREQGWQPSELLGSLVLAVGASPGLIPDARHAMNLSRESAPAELVPIAEFSPDDSSRALLRLSDQQFLSANRYNPIRVAPNRVNFFDYEMNSVQKRVEELLDAVAPKAAPELARLDDLKRRFDLVRGQSDAVFERFADFRTSALREQNPIACINAGAMFLAGAFYTTAEELFKKALELLPGSSDAHWGLAQAYYGLALFDLIERGQFEVVWLDMHPALLNSIRRAPLKYDISAILGLSMVGSLNQVFLRKGVDAATLRILLPLLGPEPPRSLPSVVPVPRWQHDEVFVALCGIVLNYAERARQDTRRVQTNQVVAFHPEDLDSFYTYLAGSSGRSKTQHDVSSKSIESKNSLEFAEKLYHQRRFEEAAEVFDQTLNEGRADSRTWNWLANCQMELEEYESAIYSFDQAIRLRPTEPSNWNDKGVALRRLYRFGEAILCFRTAHSLEPTGTICQQNIDGTRQIEKSLGETARNIVPKFAELSEGQRATFYRAAFAQKRALQLEKIGEQAQAARCFDEAIKLYGELPHCHSLELAALEGYCSAAEKSGVFPPSAMISARLRIRELISILRLDNVKFQSEGIENEAAIQLGAAFLKGGRWEHALWISNEFSEKCRRQGAFHEELRFLCVKTAALECIGALPEAERTQVRVLEICKDTRNHVDSGVQLLQELMHAEILLHLGRFQEVCDRVARTREAASRAGVAQMIFHSDVLRASSLFGLRRYDEAYQSFSRILATAQQGKPDIPNLDSYLARLLHHTGKSLRKLGRIDEALEKHRAALQLERVWWIYEGLSSALETRRSPGDLAEAFSSRLRAIEQAEKASKSFSVSDFQMSWFEDKADIYANLVFQLLHMDLDDIPITERDIRKLGNSVEELALHFADRGKGRTLLQLMSVAVGSHHDGGQGRLLEERRALADEISALLKVRGALPRPGARREFEMETTQIEEKLTRQREIEALLHQSAGSEFMELDTFAPNEFRGNLRSGECCIEYVVMEKHLLILVITNGSVDAHQVDIPQRAPMSISPRGKVDARRLAELYRQSSEKAAAIGLEGLILLHRDWMDNWHDSALSEHEHIGVSAALGEILLPAKVRRRLAEKQVKHLLIVPSHWLALTPFSTLVLETDSQFPSRSFRHSRFVLHEYSISFVQSLGVLCAIRKRQRPGSPEVAHELLAFGDPIHYNSDPRASEQSSQDLGAPAEGRARAEAAELSLLRSFRELAMETAEEEVWPRLEETGMEVLSVAKTFKHHVVFDSSLAKLPSITAEAVVCLGHAANRDVALSKTIERSRNILFSVHGHADLSNPWLSHLMLTDRTTKSGFRRPAPLTMTDAFNMALIADTVVLAACETALGRLHAGEGIVGFPLAFLFAGARSVVLTQWQIPSGFRIASDAPEVYPSTRVVTRFYKNWREGGMSLAEALQQAQIELYKEHDAFADPFFWGAWQIYGEWLNPSAETPKNGVPKAASAAAQSSHLASVAHPAADPNRAAQLNIEFMQQLKQWETLPLWKRLITRKPERPSGI